MSQMGVTATEQYIQNSSFDPEYGVLVVLGLGTDGTNVVRQVSDQVALKLTESGSISYIAVAPVGSAQSAAVWQAKKVDETTGVVITWADGNTSFDNVATDLTALSYS